MLIPILLISAVLLVLGLGIFMMSYASWIPNKVPRFTAGAMKNYLNCLLWVRSLTWLGDLGIEELVGNSQRRERQDQLQGPITTP